MKKYLIIIFLFFFPNFSFSKTCKPKIIKVQTEIEEKLKICDKGDKILVLYDIKVDANDLILKICDLKYTIISRDETKIIYKRNSGLSLICIFDPSFN